MPRYGCRKVASPCKSPYKLFEVRSAKPNERTDLCEAQNRSAHHKLSFAARQREGDRQENRKRVSLMSRVAHTASATSISTISTLRSANPGALMATARSPIFISLMSWIAS